MKAAARPDRTWTEATTRQGRIVLANVSRATCTTIGTEKPGGLILSNNGYMSSTGHQAAITYESGRRVRTPPRSDRHVRPAVKSHGDMKENLEEMNSRECRRPVAGDDRWRTPLTRLTSGERPDRAVLGESKARGERVRFRGPAAEDAGWPRSAARHQCVADQTGPDRPNARPARNASQRIADKRAQAAEPVHGAGAASRKWPSERAVPSRVLGNRRGQGHRRWPTYSAMLDERATVMGQWACGVSWRRRPKLRRTRPKQRASPLYPFCFAYRMDARHGRRTGHADVAYGTIQCVRRHGDDMGSRVALADAADGDALHVPATQRRDRPPRPRELLRPAGKRRGRRGGVTL